MNEEYIKAELESLRADVEMLKSIVTEANLKEELKKLRGENEALKKTAPRGLSMKVSEKGALSVYGLGRFPVTLYKEQWIRLLDLSDDIRSFIQNNSEQLQVKG